MPAKDVSTLLHLLLRGSLPCCACASMLKMLQCLALEVGQALCMAVRAAYQKAVRDQKLATEISAAKRERDFYMSSVAKAKATAAQKERKLRVGSPRAMGGMSKQGLCYACMEVLMYDNVYANI